jgi:hypothetical protein
MVEDVLRITKDIGRACPAQTGIMTAPQSQYQVLSQYQNLAGGPSFAAFGKGWGIAERPYFASGGDEAG